MVLLKDQFEALAIRLKCIPIITLEGDYVVVITMQHKIRAFPLTAKLTMTK
jgi:hypothetical protein